MKNTMLKNAFSEIKKTKNRFFSIFGIIAIGTGFFAGLLASAPDMKKTADTYYDETNLMDFRLVSTYGFSDSDIEELQKIDGLNIYPGYFTDAFIGSDGSDKVARVYSLDEMGENNEHSSLWLTEGRMPEKENECVLDAGKLVSGYKIGDKITLSGDASADINDTLEITEYEIVGRFDTPMFISDTERGNTTIGTGTVNMLIYIPEENFKTEVYTQVFVTCDDLREMDSYSEEYEGLRDNITDKLKGTAKVREDERLREIKQEAKDKIAEARAELAKEKAKIYAEIADNEKKLAEAKKEIDDGEKQLADGAVTLKDSKAELDDAKIQLDDAKTQLEEAEKEIKDGKAQLDEGKKELDDAKKELDKGKAELEKQEPAITEGKAELDKAKTQLDEAKVQLDEGKAQLDETKPMIDFFGSIVETIEGSAINTDALTKLIDSAEKAGIIDKETADELRPLFDGTKTVAEIRKLYDDALKQYNDGLAQYEDGKKQYEEGYAKYEEGLAEYNEGLKLYEDGKKQIEDGYDAYYDGLFQYYDGLSQYYMGYSEYKEGVALYEKNYLLYEQGLAQYEEGLKEFEKNRELFEEGKKEYEDGVKALEDGKKEADEKFAEAEEEIDKNEKEIDELSEIEWYVFTRDDNPGYSEYGENALRISYIAVVFPLFFVMIAALVCLTTMTRMVDEQRTQIGTLKALGYSNTSIMMKYIIYASIAAFAGALLGTLVGLKLFPGVIIIAYGMMYKLHALVMPYDIMLMGIVILASILLVLITVYFACTAILREQPSELMRPKAPKVGKKILIERIGIIWKHLSFSQKVTMRNLFRYKRRMFMTVVGIAGCTALVLTGFGIYDSVSDILNKQFDEISLHTGIAVYSDDGEEKADTESIIQLLEDNDLDTVDVYMKTLNVKANGKSADTTIFAVKDNEDLAKCVNVKDRITGEKYSLTNDGIIINEKLATLLGNIKKGEEITVYITETETVQMTVSDICENYAGHYLYITEEYYSEVVEESVPYNSVYFITEDGAELSEKERDNLAAKLMKIDGMMAVSYKRATAGTFTKMLESLLFVIILLIVSAGALAFIVLYNLTNININERIREIATLKVLGFYDKETSVYVFREIMLLTLLGSGAGLLLGRVLLDFVVKTIEIDMVMFGREVHMFSFFISVAITLVFAVIVMLVMHKHLKNIDMVEALKSVE
ncbi:MAG: FtsX-like permease family protein [Ruminococcaceae bacterium]|nr:FtsX-like permease family protein [Oscillospiraceae bacterium]